MTFSCSFYIYTSKRQLGGSWNRILAVLSGRRLAAQLQHRRPNCASLSTGPEGLLDPAARRVVARATGFDPCTVRIGGGACSSPFCSDFYGFSRPAWQPFTKNKLGYFFRPHPGNSSGPYCVTKPQRSVSVPIASACRVQCVALLVGVCCGQSGHPRWGG